MRDGTKLLIGDVHGRKLDFSRVKEYFDKVDIIISLGDLVDEYMVRSKREKFLEELPAKLSDFSDNVFIVRGNHDKACVKYEKKYNKKKENEIAQLRSLGESSGKQEPLTKIDGSPKSFKFTDELLKGAGVFGDYVCVNECGEMFGWSSDADTISKASSKKYEVYVARPNGVPQVFFNDRNAKAFHLLSHYQDTSRFSSGYADYFHGHRHDLYDDGLKISSSIFTSPAKKRWKILKSFEYRLHNGDVRESSRHTPSISFFVKKDQARIELIPGIYGDWMVFDPKNHRVIYGSSITMKATEISVDELFDKVRKKANIRDDYKLLI